MDALAVLAVLAATAQVQAAEVSDGDLGGLSAVSDVLDQGSGDGDLISGNSAEDHVAVSGHDLDLLRLTEVEGPEDDVAGADGGSVLVTAAARHNVGVLGTNGAHEGKVNVDLMALFGGVAAALLVEAAERDLLLQNALEVLGTALSVEGLSGWDLDQAAEAGGVNQRDVVLRRKHRSLRGGLVVDGRVRPTALLRRLVGAAAGAGGWWSGAGGVLDSLVVGLEHFCFDSGCVVEVVWCRFEQ